MKDPTMPSMMAAGLGDDAGGRDPDDRLRPRCGVAVITRPVGAASADPAFMLVGDAEVDYDR